MAKKIFVALVLSLAGGLWWLSRGTPPGFPYPYDTHSVNGGKGAPGENAHILLVGDRMGVKLAPHLEKWAMGVSGELSGPPEVVNRAGDGEGLHRTLAKIKSLKTLPPVVIYHGGTREFWEKRVEIPRDYQALLENLRVHRTGTWRDVLQLLPGLRHLIYRSYHTVVLTDEPREVNLRAYPASLLQKLMKATYELFTEELRELIDWVGEKKSALIVIPPVLDIDRHPGRVCENATGEEIEERQMEVEGLLRRGDFKRAYNISLQLVRTVPGNARSFYLLGRAARGVGKEQLARAALYRARAFDCDLSRGNIVINKILIAEAEKAGVAVLDFNRLAREHPAQGGYEVLLKKLDPLLREALGF